MVRPEESAAARRRGLDPRALWIGAGSGAAAILCCVSPVVLYVLGLATATEAISLGDRLYYGYAWYFRGAGVLVAAVAVILYLRRRRSCSLAGLRANWRTVLGIALVMVATYGTLYAATGYLAVLGSHHR